MSNENQIDLELANEALEDVKQRICEAGGAVTGFRPDAVFYNAELAAISQILVASDLCSEAAYTNIVAGNLSMELRNMVDMGIADVSILQEAETTLDDEYEAANPE